MCSVRPLFETGSMQGFLKQIKRNFYTTGALLPSSKPLARELTRYLAPGNRQPVRILEAGPGTGAISRMIAKRMIPGDTLDAVEINPAFAHAIRDLIATDKDFDPRREQIRVIQADLLSLSPPSNGQANNGSNDGSHDGSNDGSSHDLSSYDMIICSLPFNNFDPVLVSKIFETMEGLLKPGGRLTYFEYWAIRTLKSIFVGSKTRLRLRAIGMRTDQIRQRMGATTRMIVANFPPALVHHLVKPISAKK